MKHQNHHELLEDEGTGYLISVSDLMSSLLFVFIITLMAYVLNFHRATQETQQKQHVLQEERDHLSAVIDDLTNSRRLRTEMLEHIRRELEMRGMRVEVDSEHGILHLTEETLQFETGRADLPADQLLRLAKVGEVLAEVLPCYVASPPPGPLCNPLHAGKLESVFVEGHTDNVPYGRGIFKDNWDLSAQRAMYIYRTMVKEFQPALAQLLNADGFPIFGVAGYGEGRPRPGHHHQTPVSDPANRRIDLRFIMMPPREDIAPLAALKEKGL
ncbi:MAG: OmpA family protein [Desulfomicrobiaceae bacterium]